MTAARLLPVAGLLLCSSCAVVKMSRVRPDYDAVDKLQVKRLAVVTRPLPDGNAKVGQLWSKIARRYANQKREFLVRKELSDNGAQVTQQELCTDGLEGVLWLKPSVQRSGDGFEAQVDATLFRCRDWSEVWAAQAAGSWSSRDDTLKETAAQYATELGPEVEPYVPATFHLLKAALDTLPNPVLSDADKDEKIELGD